MEQFYNRTDLAIEVKESFPEDQVEIRGVKLREETDDTGDIKLTTVEIVNEHGAAAMKKPMGMYITLEFEKDALGDNEKERQIVKYIKRIIKVMVASLEKKEKHTFQTFLFSGLGNRFATPDALGPYVLEKITMNRHIEKEFGYSMEHDGKLFCGIAPGVMSQTGMESSEIIKGVVGQIQPDVLLVIDSLASTSINRLCSTIQVTDTGISPGAGIGNNRKQINKDSIGIPVIAIGVPTVVEAGTIVYEVLRETFLKEGYKEEEIDTLIGHFSNEKLYPLFVTPKEIDDEIKQIGRILSNALQEF
ncbi:MAG: GPR endopeptidase [Lachnospiraceae bacterium]|nr:GPR endopeptidase [Lachnospiraceae bacterium]